MDSKITPNDIIDLLGGTAKTAKLSQSAWSTVSEWRLLKKIPGSKLFLLAYPLEVASEGKWCRKKLFPDVWRQVWPELDIDHKPNKIRKAK